MTTSDDYHKIIKEKIDKGETVKLTPRRKF